MGSILDRLNLTEQEIYELKKELDNRNEKLLYERNIATIEYNRKYIGKCFYDSKNNLYLRVLSSRSSNEYRFECLCFVFPVRFEENTKLRMLFTPDQAFSTIKFQGIYVDDFPLLCYNSTGKYGNGTHGKVIDGLVEITESDYFAKMDEYLVDLKEKVKSGEFDTSKNIRRLTDV